MASYKGIQFAKGYNRSFADFKNEFSSTHVFKKIPPKERELALKEAYKIATKGNKPKKTSSNGNTIRAAKPIEKNKP